MKAIKSGGYIHLVNDEKQPQYCIKRNPVSALVPDKLGQPVAIESQTRASMCGNHCPFFDTGWANSNNNNGFVVTLKCSSIEIDLGINEIIDQDQQTNKLKLV